LASSLNIVSEYKNRSIAASVPHNLMNG